MPIYQVLPVGPPPPIILPPVPLFRPCTDYMELNSPTRKFSASGNKDCDQGLWFDPNDGNFGSAIEWSMFFFFKFWPLESHVLWAAKTREQNTCKTDLNRKTQHMLYFWKAGGSRMSNMTFPCVNPIQLGPSLFRPHNAKKALYVIISGEIPEN